MSPAKSSKDKQADLRDRTRAAVIYGDESAIKALPDSALVEAVRIAFKGDSGGRGPSKRLTYRPSPHTLAVVLEEMMERANGRVEPEKRVTVTIEPAVMVDHPVTVTSETKPATVTVTAPELTDRDRRILELAGLSEVKAAAQLQAEGIKCSPRTVGNVRRRYAEPRARG